MAVRASSLSGGQMKVVIFGASGMVGQGALQECLRDPDVQRVVSVVRAATAKHHQRLVKSCTRISSISRQSKTN